MAEHLYRKRISASAASNVDDMVSKNVLAQLRRDPPPRPPSHNPKDPGKPGGGGAGNAVGGVEAADLISSMAKRLGALERDMKERQNLLQQVQADNAALKAKLKAAEQEVAKRALASIEPRDDSAAVMHLRAENSRLRAQLKYAWKQVAEMKAFLNDYGMVWMGEPEAEAELVAHGFGPAASAADDAPSTSGSGAAAPDSLTLLSEPSDPLEPRRRSHNGAGCGPSSAAAAAAAAAAAEAGGRRLGTGAGDERARSSGRGAAAAAAAAALGRAGEGDAPPPGVARRGGSFTSLPYTAAAPATAVGGQSGSAGPSPRSGNASSSTSSTTLPPLVPPARPGLPVSMAELRSKVDELNDLAGDGCGQVVKAGAGAHVLATQEPVSLVVYRDGLQIHTLPAKPFNDSASVAVLRDILDGYFPYVLKHDFPDGVPLRVVDRSGDSIDSVAARAGGRGGGGGGGGGGGARGGNVRTFDDIDSHAGAGEPLSRDKFLSRLPQAVIKNGKVIEIRGDIARMLGGGAGGVSRGEDGGKADVALISTPVDALLSTMQRNHVGPSLPPPSREGQAPTTEVTTLQVKSVDGKQTYILKLKYDDTVGSLRSCINAHHAKSGQSGVAFEIRSAFPARAYTDEGETLRQAGLVPNATLFLRAL